MQLPDLLLLLIDRLDLFLSLLGELLQLFLHPTDLVCCLSVFIVFESLLLSFSYLLQRLLLLLQRLKLTFQVL
jgi:hypothetical protein